MQTASSQDGRTARRLANRDRILDVALDLVAVGAEVSVETIADRAAVSVRSVYNHFPTARALVAGMYERGSERVLPILCDQTVRLVDKQHAVERFVNFRIRFGSRLAGISSH